MHERPLHALELQRGNLVARGRFDRLELAGTRGKVFHECLLQKCSSVFASLRTAKSSILLSRLAFRTENRWALFLEMLWMLPA
ncbi:hypothetical protein FP026_05180 [Rhizobium tropici]|uniref:Uncharacterized protein n=1 Tax=Rhizobium tropici TaxID=398 RepID=A0A5B0WCX4_RHITR|nr:hypothetical protein FP026_05180 [Rhizobium tropici]